MIALQTGKLVAFASLGSGAVIEIYRRTFHETTYEPIEAVEEVVNRYTSGPQELPAAALLANGNYVVSWTGIDTA